MKALLTTFAFALVSVCAWGGKSTDYQFKVVVQSGQTIGDYQMSGFGDPAINDVGDILFDGYVKAPIGSSTFFAGLFSPEGLVVQANGSLPACFGPYAVNDAGQIAFVENSNLSPTEPNVSGVYTSTIAGGSVQTIVAPGAVLDGVQFLEDLCTNTANANGGDFSFNHAGRIAFLASNGIYEYTSKKGLVKVKTDEIDGYPLTGFALVNGQPEELLIKGSTSSFEGIFARDRLLLKTGEEIDGIKLTSIVVAVASRDEKLAVTGTFGSSSANDYAIVTRDSVVAKTGQTISGKVISSPGFFGLPAVNDAGEVVFGALFGAGVYPNDLAIATHDEIIIAVGDSINGLTITSLGQPALNEYGVIAFLASFSDGTQAIVEAMPYRR